MLKVREQSLYRRALWLLQHTHYNDVHSFGKVLCMFILTRPLSNEMLTRTVCTDREAERIIKRLRTLGLLAPSLGSTKKAKDQIALNKKDTAKAKMTRAFFNPTFGIEHHVRLVWLPCLMQSPSKHKTLTRLK